MAEQHTARNSQTIQNQDPRSMQTSRSHDPNNDNSQSWAPAGLYVEASTSTTYDECAALSTLEVFYWVVNKMIGSGIFMTPPMVLALTPDWRFAIILWAVAFWYNVMSMMQYLSFAEVFHSSAGELVTVDKITCCDDKLPDPPYQSTRISYTILRHLGDGLCAFTVYAVLLVFLFNSGANSLQVGVQILLCINPHEENPDRLLMWFMAIVILSIVCLLHCFSGRAGRTMNKYFCWMKLVIIIVLVAVLMKRAIMGPRIGRPKAIGNVESFSNLAWALLLVLFSFQGWGNASFIAGKTQKIGHKPFRRGHRWAIAVVGILYSAMNVSYVLAVDGDGSLPETDIVAGFAAQLFGNSFRARRCWAVLTAFSSLGSLISTSDTFSRAKQAIGVANILPYSGLWKQDFFTCSGCASNSLDTSGSSRTPKGGLIMHWLSTVAVISTTAVAVQNIPDVITFPGILQTYTHALILAFITMGLFGVGAHSKSLGQSNSASGWIRLPDGNFKWPIRAALILFIACNGFVVLTFLVHPSSGIVPHWVIPTAPFAAVILGFLYYFLVFWSSASQDRLAQTHNSGHFQTLRQQCSLLTFAGVTCNIDKDVFYAARYKSLVRRFGTQRIITFEQLDDSGNSISRFLFWFFGGEVDISPLQRLTLSLETITRSILECFPGESDEESDKSSVTETLSDDPAVEMGA